MKHKWGGGMTVGTPDNPPEGYSYCDNCGAEETDDNRDEECQPAEDDDPTVGPILPPYEG